MPYYLSETGFTGGDAQYGDNVTGRSASPVGAHYEGARANKKRCADIFENGFHFTKKRLPSPGAQNYAFDTLGLVEFDPIGGGVQQQQQMRAFEPSFLYVNGQSVVTNGFGGLVPGQIFYQPLIDPYNNTYGGY